MKNVYGRFIDADCLAGMPEEAIAIASKVLEQMKVYNSGHDASPPVLETPRLASSG